MGITMLITPNTGVRIETSLKAAKNAVAGITPNTGVRIETTPHILPQVMR